MNKSSLELTHEELLSLLMMIETSPDKVVPKEGLDRLGVSWDTFSEEELERGLSSLEKRQLTSRDEQSGEAVLGDLLTVLVGTVLLGEAQEGEEYLDAETGSRVQHQLCDSGHIFKLLSSKK